MKVLKIVDKFYYNFNRLSLKLILFFSFYLHSKAMMLMDAGMLIILFQQNKHYFTNNQFKFSPHEKSYDFASF